MDFRSNLIDCTIVLRRKTLPCQRTMPPRCAVLSRLSVHWSVLAASPLTTVTLASQKDTQVQKNHDMTRAMTSEIANCFATQEAHNYRKQDQLFHMVMHLPCALAAVSEAVQVRHTV